MPKLIIKPSGTVIEVSEGQDLLSVLRENNLYVKSSCGGHATCSDCIVKVTSGEANLVAPNFNELKLLGNVFHITKERLACQTTIVGDVSIDISAHDQSKDEARVKQKTSMLQQKKMQKVKVKKSSDLANQPFEDLREEKKTPSSVKKLDGNRRPKKRY